MSNDLLTPPEIDARPARFQNDHTSLLPVDAEGSVWTSLVSNLRDVFRPQKLPPLELTSTPVPTPDLLAEKRGPLSSSLSIGTHVLIIALIIGLFLWGRMHPQPKVKQAVLTQVDISPFIPVAPKMARLAGGGGGGGNHDIIPPSKGRLPTMAKVQITPPQVLRVDHPKLAVEPTIVMPQQIKLPDANMPNLGIPQASAVTLSQGSGRGSGFGSGSGGGIGSGNGGGVGPGSGGGTGGGVYHPGGGISTPKIIFSVDPEFSDEARRAKYQGVVVISLIVDAQGNPQHVRVTRQLGMGLDEKAVEAVKQYKFKPALMQGKPVPVEINIEVNFQLF